MSTSTKSVRYIRIDYGHEQAVTNVRYTPVAHCCVYPVSDSHCGLQELEDYRNRLHQLEKRFGHESPQYTEEVKEVEAKFGKGAAS